MAGFFGGGVRRVFTATKGKGRDGLRGLGWETEWIDWGDILRWRAGSGAAGGAAIGEIVRREEFDEEGPEEVEGDFVV